MDWLTVSNILLIVVVMYLLFCNKIQYINNKQLRKEYFEKFRRINSDINILHKKIRHMEKSSQ